MKVRKKGAKQLERSERYVGPLLLVFGVRI